MQHLTALERTILVAAAADIQRLSQGESSYTRDGWRQRVAREEALQGIVKLDAPRWLNCETASDPSLRMQLSRSYLSLQQRGLAVRVVGGYRGTRATHLRITPEGMALAAELSKATTEATTDAP